MIKRLSLVILVISAVVDSTHAITVTVDETLSDATHLVFDVVWGQIYPGGNLPRVESNRAYWQGVPVWADDENSAIWIYQPLYVNDGRLVGGSSFAVGLSPDRSYPGPIGYDFSWAVPGVFTEGPTPDGFGARFSYTAPVPDGGSTATLLGIVAGVYALARPRKLLTS